MTRGGGRVSGAARRPPNRARNARQKVRPHGPFCGAVLDQKGHSMSTFGDDFEAQDGDSDAPEQTFAEHLEDALNGVCEAWEVDAEGHELVERLRVAAARLARRKGLPPRPIREVLWRAEVAPGEFEVIAKWHAPILPVERWFRREMLAGRVPEELDIPLLLSFLRRLKLLLARRGEAMPEPVNKSVHVPAPTLTEAEAQEQWRRFLLRFDPPPEPQK